MKDVALMVDETATKVVLALFSSHKSNCNICVRS